MFFITFMNEVKGNELEILHKYLKRFYKELNLDLNKK